MGRLKSVVRGLFVVFFVVGFFCCGSGKGWAAHLAGATDEYLCELTRAKGVVLTEVTGFGSNPGALRMYKFVPTPEPQNAPLVVVLHGCTQNAHEYAARSEWNVLAQRFGFLVLYPEQQTSNNPMQGFNWFEPGDCRRDQGESGSIKQMIDRMKADHAIDPGRVFVTGLSSGGCFTTVLCCVYPEVFAAGSSMAGLPFRCAQNMTEGFTAMFMGVRRTPQEWARLATELNPGYTGKYPGMVIFQGTRDTAVKPVNMPEIMKQFTALGKADQEPDATDSVKGYPRRVYRDTEGKPVVVTYEMTNMPHGIAIDPGTAEDQGGSAGSFANSVGLYSSYYTLVNWGLVPGMTKDVVAAQR